MGEEVGFSLSHCVEWAYEEDLPTTVQKPKGRPRKNPKAPGKTFVMQPTPKIFTASFTLLNGKNVLAPNGWEMLETGMRQLLAPFLKADTRVRLEPPREESGELRMTVAPDSTIPRKLPALHLNKDGISFDDLSDFAFR